MATPQQIVAQKVVQGVVKGIVKDAARSARRDSEVRKGVDGQLDTETPKDPQLAEDLEALKHVETREQFEVIADRIQAQSSKIGRDVGRKVGSKHPQTIMGLKIPIVSRQMGASMGANAGESRALSLAETTINHIDETSLKPIEAMQKQHLEYLKNDFSRAEALRKQGKLSEAKILEDKAKGQLNRVGKRVQTAYGLDAVGKTEDAAKKLCEAYRIEASFVKEHAILEIKQADIAQQNLKNTVSSGSITAATVESARASLTRVSETKGPVGVVSNNVAEVDLSGMRKTAPVVNTTSNEVSTKAAGVLGAHNTNLSLVEKGFESLQAGQTQAAQSTEVRLGLAKESAEAVEATKKGIEGQMNQAKLDVARLSQQMSRETGLEGGVSQERLLTTAQRMVSENPMLGSRDELLSQVAKGAQKPPNVSDSDRRVYDNLKRCVITDASKVPEEKVA